MLRRGCVSLTLVSALLVAIASGTSGAAPGSAAKTRKTCIVHRYTASGKKVVFRVRVYRYKYVRRHGARVRTIVRRKVALRGSCVKRRACVKIKVTAAARVRIVYARKRVWVRVKRGNKLVMRRLRRQVPVLGRCVKPDTSLAALGVPVRITILPPSKALLDFGAFQRETPIAGSLKGYSPQPKIDLKEDVPIVLTSATVALGSTPIYIDQECAGRATPSLRTGRGASARLDGSRSSTSMLSASGAITATTFLTVRLPLELRDGEAGCDKPYIDTQYSEWPFRLSLAGRLDPRTGLTKLHLTSAPTVAANLSLCLNPGLQTEPCTGFQIPLPIPIATDVYVKVELNPK